MKFASLIILLVFVFPLPAQERLKAVLVDEHGQLPCDDSLGRIDMWYAELSNYPGSIGLAVISSSPEQKHRAVFYQRLMKANATFRGADGALTLKYVRANSPGPLNVRLWRIPVGGQYPIVEGEDSTLTIPGDSRPFTLGSEFDDIGGVCPDEGSDQLVFAEFLKANPQARGNIVVRERTLTGSRRRAARLERDLHRRFGIPSSRLRFFLRKSSVSANNFEPVVEYWYLP